ncbi:hypothetical protein H072_10986 [Dactylellina haptotyla CBS 200.50]|uniref:DUF221-domain-containing protein n=1 Tax=Dactylellina haptotyla (strain CBS 200.50) TaxID=1284197 RepID=S8B953_DACHA|nr:hypothetical protein H072_10986 [Dactylellina haptotyla CBS 200.50]
MSATAPPSPSIPDPTGVASSAVSSARAVISSNVASLSSNIASISSNIASLTSQLPSPTASNNGTGFSIGLDNDPTASQAEKFVGISVQALLATMSGAFALFVIQTAVFVVIRRRLQRIYEPRTYMVPERKKTHAPPSGWFAWIPAMLTTRDPEYISKSGLDAFCFLRFLRMMLKICCLQGMLILPIMLPINATGGMDKDPEVPVQGLDRLGWGNISRDKTQRRTAALLMAIYAIGVVLYVTYDEMRGYVRLRQAYLTSPQHRLRASATTVLVTSIPKRWMTYDEMINLYDILPGGLKNVWLNRDYSELVEKIELREHFAKKLEAAETDLIKKCVKKYLKQVKKEKGRDAAKTAEDGVEMVEGLTKGTPDDLGFQGHKHSHRPLSDPFASPVISRIPEEADRERNPSADTNGMQYKEGEDDVMDPKDFEYREDPPSALWRKYIQPKDRETMRVPVAKWMPSLPLIGRKVDTIYYCRQQLATLNEQIPKDQAKPEKFPLMNSAFLQFQSQIAAHMACQATNHHIPLRMAPRYLEVAPADVIWENLHMRWWDRYLRYGASNAAVAGLIIAWSIPMVFIASLSQISHLANLVPWLAWLEDLPKWLLSAIQGLLPPLLLSLLTAVLVPLLLQTLAKYSGKPTRTAADRAVQNWYFAFLFLTVFFVVSLSSALFGAIRDFVKDPVSIPVKLAATLPRASNFFFSYLLVQALGISGGALLQVAPLFLYYVIGPMINHTPREKWSLAKNLKFVTWGTFFPLYTNFGVISIVYAVIAPLSLLFAGMVFGLFWLVYRYNLLYVMDYQVDSGGLFFPKAINHLYAGIYIMEICLTGLFLLVRDEHDDLYCLPHAIIMLVIFFLTIIFQRVMYTNFAPLLEYLPITLEDDADASDKEFARRYEERRRLLQEDTVAANQAALEKIDEAHDAPDDLEPIAGKRVHEKQDGHDGTKPLKEETVEERAQKVKEKEKQKEAGVADSENDSSDSSDSDSDSDEEELKRPGTSHSKASTKASKKAKLGAITNALGINKIAAIGAVPLKQLKKIPGIQMDLVHRLAELRDQEDKDDVHESDAVKKKRRLEIARIVRQIRQDDYSDYTDVNDLRRHILESAMPASKPHYDDEEQQQVESKTRRLFAHIDDDLGDLTYEQREALMEQAYKHPCLIARQPAVWIPTDVLGISTDEIKNTPPEVWISNEKAYLKYHSKVVFEGNPPDFGHRDLIDL